MMYFVKYDVLRKTIFRPLHVSPKGNVEKRDTAGGQLVVVQSISYSYEYIKRIMIVNYNLYGILSIGIPV